VSNFRYLGKRTRSLFQQQRRGLPGSSGRTCLRGATKRCYSWTSEGGADGAKLEQSLETDGLWRGDSWTVNISEWPSAESVSLLSSTLEVNAPEKYYLSARACQGILTRASRRGKKLPDLLQTALLEMIEWWEPGSSAAVVEMLIAEERRRTEQEKAKQRKERVVTNAVKQLRIRLKSALGAPEAERALLCKQKKSGHYRHSKTKRSSN